MGALIRDSNNKIIAIIVKSIQFTRYVKTTKAATIEWGLIVLKNAIFRYLMIETNCQGLGELVNNKEGSKTKIIWMILKIQNQSELILKSNENVV